MPALLLKVQRWVGIRAGCNGSTMMSCASCWLIARRELQTWQMKLAWLVSNRMIWSSQKPNSRSRFCISGPAQSCRIRTATPAFTRLSGHTSQRASDPGSTVRFQLILPGTRLAPASVSHYTDFVICWTLFGKVRSVPVWGQEPGSAVASLSLSQKSGTRNMITEYTNHTDKRPQQNPCHPWLSLLARP